MSTSKELTESGQDNVLDRLPFNLTQLMTFAMNKPRNPMQAIDSAIAQLRAAPQFAEKAYYSIPFKRSDGTEEIVEGPSIKAATALSGCWGNNVEGAFLAQETDGYVDIFGYFFDYETGKLTIRPWRVSKTYRSRKGEVLTWRYDMLLKQIQAGVSKAIRNADLNGLPAGYVASYFAEAKRIAARGGKITHAASAAASPAQAEADDIAAIAKKLSDSLRRFQGMGVSGEIINEYVSRHPELHDEEAVSSHLVGLLNGIDDQQITIDEIFSGHEAEIKEPQRVATERVGSMNQQPIGERPAPPKPDAPAPVVPQPTPPAPVLPADRRRMQAKFDAGTCVKCRKPIKKSQWIWKSDAGWEHEVC